MKKKPLVSIVWDEPMRPDCNNSPDLHRGTPSVADVKESFRMAVDTACDPRNPYYRNKCK